jgi:ParB/RepB/Spo0J family partition protein
MMNAQPQAIPTDVGVRPGEFVSIELDKLRESATNPRKHFDKAQLQELAESIKSKGVLMPLLVRPMAGKLASLYEVVAGERRFKASKLAGLDAVPCRIRHLADAEVIEIQVIENLHRSDLHPLEEAEGYEQLMKSHNYTAEDLAAKVGKSKAYVYARLKLCALAPESRKAFYDGKLNPSTALLIARIPVPELQERAVKEITEETNYRPAMNVRAAADHIQRTYMLQLDGASFKKDDAKLVPEAGPCTTCPKRTGNQKDLFADVKSADVCTDPVCFAKKRDAHWALQTAAAHAAGRQVLEDKKGGTEPLFQGGRFNNYARGAAKYVDLADTCYDDPKNRTYRALLGNKADEHVVLARDDRDKAHELIPKETAAKLVKAVLPTSVQKQLASRARDQASYRHQQRDATLKARRDALIRARVTELVLAKVKHPLDKHDLELVAGAFFEDVWHEYRKKICIRRGWKGAQNLEGLKADFRKGAAALDAAGLSRLLVEIATVKHNGYGFGGRDRLKEAAKRYGVDFGAVSREITKAEAAKHKAKTAKKKAA